MNRLDLVLADRPAASYLARMRAIWVLTVAGLMNNDRAASPLESCRSQETRTSTSRADRRGRWRLRVPIRGRGGRGGGQRVGPANGSSAAVESPVADGAVVGRVGTGVGSKPDRSRPVVSKSAVVIAASSELADGGPEGCRIRGSSKRRIDGVRAPRWDRSVPIAAPSGLY